MLSCRCDRIKAWPDKMLLSSSEFIQLLRSADFRNPLRSYVFFQPFHKSDMAYTVLHLSLSNIRNLHGILTTLEHHLWVSGFHYRHTTWDLPVQCIVHARSIQKECRIRKLPYLPVNLFICKKSDSRAGKSRL